MDGESLANTSVMDLRRRVAVLFCPCPAFLPYRGLPHARRYNKSMSEENTAPLTFEASLEQLERIVRDLEKGDLPLEQSLALFETGMRLSAECKRQLEQAESRVEILMKKGSEMVAVPFNPDKPAK